MIRIAISVLLALIFGLTAPLTAYQGKQNGRPLKRRPDVIYYPTPEETVAEMLRLANIKQGDVLYDLGSGDGRIPIMAAQKYGIRAVGIEIDPKLIAVAQERAREAQVTHLVSFRHADMFRTNLSPATVVTLYLSNKLNLLMRPKLLSELRPGARIVSHDFHMGDWPPDTKVTVPWHGNLFRTVYLWTVPARKAKRRGRTTASSRPQTVNPAIRDVNWYIKNGRYRPHPGNALSQSLETVS